MLSMQSIWLCIKFLTYQNNINHSHAIANQCIAIHLTVSNWNTEILAVTICMSFIKFISYTMKQF